jgi:exportin-5
MFNTNHYFHAGATANNHHNNNNNHHHHTQFQPGMENIVHALELIHSPTSTNEIRQQASEFLELQKNEKSAAQNGYSLSSQANNSPVVRHFGLSLLEHVVRHRSSGLHADEFTHLRGLILDLAEGIQIQDPPYIRNKVAQLWAEIAKRSWGIDWLGMDESLVKMWSRDLVHKEFVLSVLETLSEDIFYREDTASSLRGTDLNRALVEIFTPFSVFQEVYPERDRRLELRCGNEGWLVRICDFLDWCTQNMHAQREVKECTLKALETLRSVMSWSIPKAIHSSQCVQRTCRVLSFGDDQVLLVRNHIIRYIHLMSNVLRLIDLLGRRRDIACSIWPHKLRDGGIPGVGRPDIRKRQPDIAQKTLRVVSG